MQFRPTRTAERSRNLLLNGLEPRDSATLLEGAEPVTLELRRVLYAPNEPIGHVYFLNNAVASIIAPIGNGGGVEIGTIGNEGLVGLPLLFGVDREPAHAIVQIADGGVRIPAASFQEIVSRRATIRTRLLRYAQSYVSQVSQSSACNRVHSIGERCARWLLMTHDRVGADVFPLTHEFLALMLGVRRAGVTVAAGTLQKAGVIEYKHGHMRIVDRTGLQGFSCPCYRIIRDGYASLHHPETAARA